jgi:hypothetical protein
MQVNQPVSNSMFSHGIDFRKGATMPRYGKKASESVEKAMHKKKRGQLKSGRSGKKVTSRKQAVAIGLSEARKKGEKVPRKKSTSSKSHSKKSS